LNPAGSEIVSDEQLIDDELNLLRVQIDVAAPPLFEAQIAWRFRVDFGIEIVRLAPERIGGILVLEILHQPCAIEFSVTEVARQSSQPAAAQQTAAVAHRKFAAHAGPI